MRTYLEELTAAAHTVPVSELDALAAQLSNARTYGATVFIAGNGGSYAVATHWATDLQKVCGIRTHVLGTNVALSTALSNDLEYGVALSTELSLMARPGDMLVCLSCSGRSRNIVSALGEARKLRIAAWLVSMATAPTYEFVRTIRFGSKDYGTVEDLFAILGHWLTQELGANHERA